MARNGGGRGTHHQQPVGGGHQGRPIVLPGGQHSIPGHQGRPIVLPGGQTIDAHVKKILDLLDKTNSRSARADAHVLKELKKVEPQDKWKDLISHEFVKQTHIQRLYDICNTEHNPVPRLNGTWRRRSWQINRDLGEQFADAFWQFLGLQPNLNDFTLMIGGSPPRYTATIIGGNPVQSNDLTHIPLDKKPCHLALEIEGVKDCKYNALPPDRVNKMACHLAFDIPDVKDVKTGSSSKTEGNTQSPDDQIILCIRIVNAYVLVGQVRKEISKEGSKTPSKNKKGSKDEELLAELVLVKVKDAK